MGIYQFCQAQSFQAEIESAKREVDALLAAITERLESHGHIQTEYLDDLRVVAIEAIDEATYETRRRLEDDDNYSGFTHHDDARIALRAGE